MFKEIDWVYDRLICELGHYDYCLTGLILDEGQIKLAEVIYKDDSSDDPLGYEIRKIAWDNDCDTYLEDYRKAYPHWFYVNGKRKQRDNLTDTNWFRKKYKGINIMKEKVIVGPLVYDN